MKTLATNFRLIVCSVLIPLALGFASQASLAQSVTVSVSPGDLSFGVPTLNPFPTTPPAPISAPDSVTVNITGTGTVTFAGATIGAPGANLADFVIEDNSCVGAITSPNTCQVTLHFKASLAPATTLETATLAISSSAGNLSVPLNGAYGAIKFFGPLNINPSLFSFTTWTQNPPFSGEPVRTNTVNLSCPAGATAVLSSTPDGLGNVFQDNTIQFANTINNVTTTTTNVCTGGDTNFSGFTGFPAGSSNCFQPAYEGAVTNYLNPPGVGQNPDLTGFPLGVGQPGSFIATFGVAPLNVSSLLTSNQLQSISIQQQDAGGDLGAATLHLATNCSLAGVTPGGSITGNPITTGNTASQTQSFPFDNGGGQSISYTTSISTALSQGTVTVPNGTIPIVTDVGIPQDLFSQLVASTSAAPAVCLRHTGEVDSHGNAMCKGYLIQCQFTDSQGNTTVSGDNCVPTLSTARNLFDLVQFSSPDAPLNGTNYLYNSSPNACSNALPGGACAMGTGPGLLMGSDNWPCAPGQVVPCTPQEPDTTTSQTPPTYSAGNCGLTGSLTGDLCPLDTLTQIKGAADIPLGGTTPGKNSLFIPVVNMPLPSTVTTITNQANGWVKSPAANVNFTSNPAAYSPSAVNPPANNFAAAQAYGVTYGITPANTPVPDSTYPVSGDTTIFNPTANPGFATPLCSPSTTASFSTPSPVSINPGGDGIYNLHYFTTDCALTEELLFNPTGTQLTDPTANWASFRFLTFGIDTVAPTFTCNSPSSSVWYNKNQTVSCTATDQAYIAGVSGSGFSPLLPNSIQGNPSETLSVSTNVAANSVNSAAATNTVPACDLAGNCVNVSAGPFMIDLQAPTISGPTLSSSAPANSNIFYVNGPPVTVTYSCSDGAGSGVASCSGPQASGTTINTTTTGNFTFTVTATDLAGNQTTSSVKYTVATAPSADLAIFELPLLLDLIERGTTGHAYPAVVDLGSSTANNVVITTVFTVPNKVLNGSLTATAGLVGCTIKGCSSVPNSGTTCSVSTTVGTSTTTATVTCNVGQLASVNSGKGEVVSVNIPILSTATVNTQFSSVTTVTSDNDPKSSNNSASEIYLVIK